MQPKDVLPSSSSRLIPRSSFDQLRRDERDRGEECDNILPVVARMGKIPWREESGRSAGSIEDSRPEAHGMVIDV